MQVAGSRSDSSGKGCHSLLLESKKNPRGDGKFPVGRRWWSRR